MLKISNYKETNLVRKYKNIILNLLIIQMELRIIKKHFNQLCLNLQLLIKIRFLHRRIDKIIHNLNHIYNKVISIWDIIKLINKIESYLNHNLSLLILRAKDLALNLLKKWGLRWITLDLTILVIDFKKLITFKQAIVTFIVGFNLKQLNEITVYI